MPVAGHRTLHVDERDTQNMTTVEDGYNTADDGGPPQIRESSGYEEQHILPDCAHEHPRTNWDSAFWIWLMVVRTGTTDDGN